MMRAVVCIFFLLFLLSLPGFAADLVGPLASHFNVSVTVLPHLYLFTSLHIG